MTAPRRAFVAPTDRSGDRVHPERAQMEAQAKPGHDPSVPLSVASVAKRLERIVYTHVRQVRAVWIGGEITDPRQGVRGSLWFSLNDCHRQSRIECVWWDPPHGAMAQLKDGVEALVLATPTVLKRVVRLVCVVRAVRPAGPAVGALALSELQRRLRNDGLFDPARKRRVPQMPRAVAVITARDSAAWHDVRAIARRRHAGIPLVLVPAQMQGASAPESIRLALQRVSQFGRFDVVIITRGGGAAAELAIYNDEALARAIASCPVPVVTAVGHELDCSIADAVADRREATPSAAAAFVIPDARKLEQELTRRRATLDDAVARWLEREGARLQLAMRRIASAAVIRGEVARRRIVRLRSDMDRGLRHGLDHGSRRIGQLRAALGSAVPTRAALARQRQIDLVRTIERAKDRRLQAERARLGRVAPMIAHIGMTRVAREAARHERLVAQLAALDPLAVLDRGYAIVRGLANQVLTSAATLEVHQSIRVQVHDGVIIARVLRVSPAGPRLTSEDTDDAEPTGDV